MASDILFFEYLLRPRHVEKFDYSDHLYSFLTQEV